MDINLILKELRKNGWSIDKDFIFNNKDFLQAIVNETENQLMLGSVVGRSEQLVCPDCTEGRDEFAPEWECPKCRDKDYAN